MPRPIGEQLHDDIVKREGRRRLSYADAQALKKVRTIGELRKLCKERHGEDVPDDASTDEIVDTWLKPPSEETSDADWLQPADIEGCVILLAIAPFLVSGYVLGNVLRWLGLDVRKLVPQCPGWISLTSVFFVAMAALLLPVLNAEWPLALSVLSSLFSGLLIGLPHRRNIDIASGLLVIIGAGATVTWAVFHDASLWWAGVVLGCMGLGYGLMKTPADFLEKRRARVFRRRTSDSD